MPIREFVITASEDTKMIDGIMTKVEVYNGDIPGPLLEVDLGDDVVVRLINKLPHPTGIHWHGIELANAVDGTPVSQDGVKVGPFSQPVAASPSGGTYLYKFKVTRPGIFWYHPHHFHSTNRVFRGLYGMIVVKDPHETTLVSGPGGVPSNPLPSDAETHQIVLSDMTICRASNPTTSYPTPAVPAADLPEWFGGLTAQVGPSPEDLCENIPLNEDGSDRLTQPLGSPLGPFLPGEIPNIQRNPQGPGNRTVEGNVVLTNGENVGGRLGGPLSAPPRALVGVPTTIPVESSRGVRLQIVNCATTRYFRLRLVDSTGAIVPLMRVGGEGGLLDLVVLEGGIQGTLDMQYDAGEILIPPSSRADVVAIIPAGEVAGNILTMWTRDFPRIGGAPNFAGVPSVPVMHLNVTGAGVVPYGLVVGDLLRSRAGFPGPAVVELLAAVPPTLPTDLITPTGGFVAPKFGMDSRQIDLTTGGGNPSINGVKGGFSGSSSYYIVPRLNSTRYAELGATLELTVANTTNADHPFHLHGFSFQPKSLAQNASPLILEREWLHNEYVDTLNIPNGYQLKLIVHLEDRELHDGVTMGGGFGRWLFHCHIFFHAHNGMISELIVTDNNGTEKPSIDVGGSWAYAPPGQNAVRFGTYNDTDGVGLQAIDPIDVNIGGITMLPGNRYRWDSGIIGDQISYVYPEITDLLGKKNQTVFRVQIGSGMDEGSDSGDPHMTTLNGTRYDFQSVGEFTLIKDQMGMEVQTRQTPVPTATPITNQYTGLKSCVSVNTAVAVRVGSHYVSYQPGREVGTLDFFINGKRAKLTTRTIHLDNHSIRGVDVDGVLSLRIDYAHYMTLIVKPRFWASNNIHYMNVSVYRTNGDQGLIAAIPEGSWLPRLRNGAALGPKPDQLMDRYNQLYKTFADSWRVSDENSLFTYASGTSTETFTDRDWPTIKPPCKLKPQFEIPDARPQKAIAEEDARIICKAITEGDLFENCVLDVAATGEKSFAVAYLVDQNERLLGTSTHISDNAHEGKEEVMVTASVIPLSNKGEKPNGTIIFTIDGEKGKPVRISEKGRASITIKRSKEGDVEITAEYTDVKGNRTASSSSPAAVYSLPEDGKGEKVEETETKPGDITPTPGDNSPSKPWYFWLLLLFIVVLIVLAVVYLM